MTVQVAGATRRPSQVAPRRWGPSLLLAALVATACTIEEKPYFGQEIRLNLADPETQYRIVDPAGREHDIDLGSTQVTVRVSGGMADKITVRAYWPNGGGICGSVEVRPKGAGPHEVTIRCERLDAGAPPPTPDAGVPPDAGPDVSPDTGPSADCVQYCQVMEQKCPTVYQSPQECLATCASYGWPPGQQNSAGNSVHCRVGQALKATTPDDPLFCYQAGPTGGGFCGPLCYNFCDAAARNCRTLLTGGTVESCRQQCIEPIPTRALRSDRGNTIECRIFWMGEAGKDDGASCDRLAGGATPCQD